MFISEAYLKPQCVLVFALIRYLIAIINVYPLSHPDMPLFIRNNNNNNKINIGQRLQFTFAFSI